jgi:hypothetical protein
MQETAKWPAPGSVDIRLSYPTRQLKLHMTDKIDRRVPTFRILEAFDATVPSAYASFLVRYILRAVRSVLSDEYKLSIAASSQTLRTARRNYLTHGGFGGRHSLRQREELPRC